MNEIEGWTDARICKELGAVSDVMVDYASSFNVGLDTSIKVAKAMRDELTATIATLRAQVAIPDEVAQTMRKLLNDERQAIKEYHYDVYGKEDLTARLSVIDNAFAWLDQQQKGHGDDK